MDRSTRHQLRGGFDSAATEYASSRPGYPGRAVAWLIGDGVPDVLDLGAGSGSLTRLLEGRARRLVAADPSRNLLVELGASSSAALVRCSAESIPLADNAFDVVTVATAFHWFDPDLALPEISRVLRPGGVLALTWNERLRTTPFGAAVSDLLRSARPSTLQGDWGAGSVRSVIESPLFADVERADFPHEQSISRDGLVALVASRSYVIALDEHERRRVLDAAAAVFDAHADGDATLALPYDCQCWRARRVDPSD